MASTVRGIKRKMLRERVACECAEVEEWIESGKPYLPDDPDGKALARELIEHNPSGFVVCFHCGLAMDLWDLLVPGFSEWCSCGAPWFMDGLDWESVRRSRPDLPQVPESGKTYTIWLS